MSDTKQNVFEQVSKVFQDVGLSVEVANRCDKAYADGTGHPEYHAPFGVDNPQAVAMNVAGMYAADTAANLIAVSLGGGVSEQSYVEALKGLAALKDRGNIDYREPEVFLALNCANLAWRAGQPFRDIATKPLGRVSREVNAQFMTLPHDEVQKDVIQIATGAAFLLSKINC